MIINTEYDFHYVELWKDFVWQIVKGFLFCRQTCFDFMFFWYIRPTESTLYKRDVINLSRIWFLHLFIQILTYIAIHYQQKISVMQISTTLYTQYFNSRTLTCVLYHLNRDALKWNPITITILMYEEKLYPLSNTQNRFGLNYSK